MRLRGMREKRDRDRKEKKRKAARGVFPTTLQRHPQDRGRKGEEEREREKPVSILVFPGTRETHNLTMLE